jgi:hypothetical protein
LLRIIESGNGPHWEQVERKWIAYFRTQCSDLLNLADGGGGSVPPESRARARQKLLGRTFTPEWRAKISAAKKGCKRPDNAERCRQMAARNKGKKMNLTPAERERRRSSALLMVKQLHLKQRHLSPEDKWARAEKARQGMRKVWLSMTPDQRRNRSENIKHGIRASKRNRASTTPKSR